MRCFSFLCFLALLPVVPLRSQDIPLQPKPVILPTGVDFINPGDVQRHLVEHPETLIIDVRTEEERKARGYILNSIHADYFHGQKTLDALAKLDKTKPGIVYCAIGGRAKMIAVEMHAIGFQKILLLKGGFDAWTATGQPVAR